MRMREITTWDVEKAGALFGGLEEHLAVEAVLQGAASGRVWVDDEEAPRLGQFGCSTGCLWWERTSRH